MLSDTLRQVIHPVAQFDGLMLDVTDGPRALAFWRTALGGRASEDGSCVLPGRGRPSREILRLRHVDVSAADDARVHLDLRLPTEAPDLILAAGAQVIRPPQPDPWWVLADSEGNQFCAFPAADDRPAGIFELVVKCSDAYGLARW